MDIREYMKKYQYVKLEKIMDCLDDNTLVKIKQKLERINNNKIDMKSGRYKTLLKIFNLILQNLNRINKTDYYQPVTDLRQVKEILRSQLLDPTNMAIIAAMKKSILKYFDKKDVGWYKRNTYKNYTLVFLRKSLKNIGLELISSKKTFKINDKKINTIQFEIH